MVTGRVGYNNTPVVARRQVGGAECGPGRQLTRSTSAYSYHQHGAAHHPRPSPRTRAHPGLIHSDDELNRDTYGYAGYNSNYNNNYNSNYNAEYSGYNSYSSYRDTEVVTLPSGARQRVSRPATAGSLGPAAMPGLRQRRPQRGGGAANQVGEDSRVAAVTIPVPDPSLCVRATRRVTARRPRPRSPARPSWCGETWPRPPAPSPAAS